MTKAKRKDKKGRILKEGEYQKADGRYMYRYKTSKGDTCYIYSWKLNPTDQLPSNKKDCISLRELEANIASETINGIDSKKAKNKKINELYTIMIKCKTGMKESSIKTYNDYYRRYIEPELGNKSVASISYTDIKLLYNKYENDYHIGTRTIQHTHSILKQIFDLAVKDELIIKNPVIGALDDINRRPVWVKKEEKYVCKEDLDRLFYFINNEKSFSYYVPLFVFLVGTGCRSGEAAALQWEDVDFENNTIIINKTLSHRNEKYEKKITHPKSLSSVRTIPMFDSVKNALQYLKDNSSKYGRCTQNISGYQNFVFLNKQHRAFTSNTIGNIVTKAVDKFNQFEKSVSDYENREANFLPNISPHWFRHTFCSLLNAGGVNPKIIQSVMGHSSLDMTFNVYTSITNKMKIDAIKNMDDFCKNKFAKANL